MSLRWRVVVAASAALLGSGCPHRAPPPRALPGLSAEQALATLRRQAEAYQRAVGRLQLSYLASDGLFKGEADLALERPRRLRVELRSFFGQPLLALAVDDDRFVFVDNGARRAVRGPTADVRLQGLLPVPVPAEVAVALLLGTIPPLPPGGTRYAPAPPDAAAALEHQAGLDRWVIEVLEPGLLTRAVAFHPGAGSGYAARLADHASITGLAFPRAGELAPAAARGAVRWRWHEIALNGQALDPETWTLAVPPGFILEEL